MTEITITVTFTPPTYSHGENLPPPQLPDADLHGIYTPPELVEAENPAPDSP